MEDGKVYSWITFREKAKTVIDFLLWGLGKKSKLLEPVIIWSVIRYFTQEFLKTFNFFSYIEAWFNDQNSKPLEEEDEIKITLVIN